MRTNSFAALAVVLVVVVHTSPVRAEGSPDEQATSSINVAMDQQYLGTRFDEALATLEQALQACGEKCSASTMARLWMYVGLVQGSGRSDQAAAVEAFREALANDPDVTLDERFVTTETEKSFRDAGGKVATAETAPAAPATNVCTPVGVSVQTRRPIPISCRAGKQAASMTLRYLPFREDEWVTLEMARAGDAFRAQIPCSATEHAGTLSYYVLVSDEAGDLLDAVGSKTRPLELSVDARATSPPPAFRGEPAPERCPAEEICPPDFPGCGPQRTDRRGTRDWQESCQASIECKPGLLCRDAHCEVAPSCDVDADCETGVCREGRCDLPEGGQPSAPAPQNHRLGFLFALDVGFVGGRDVCTAAASDYECFERGTDAAYPPELDPSVALSSGEPGDPYPGARMQRGATVGTRRVLFDYARIVSPELSLGGRLGWSFGGGPSRAGSPSFLPLHAEARVEYWPLGAEGLLQPRLGLAVGLAQVDLSGKVTVRDCSTQQTRAEFQACIAGDENVDPERLPQIDLAAYRKLGRGFVAVGGGLVVPLFGPSYAEVGLRVMYLLPEVGFVLQPSAGAGYAF